MWSAPDHLRPPSITYVGTLLPWLLDILHVGGEQEAIQESVLRTFLEEEPREELPDGW